MTLEELQEQLDATANQFVDLVRARVDPGPKVDEWEDAFRWALEKPDNPELRQYCDAALKTALNL